MKDILKKMNYFNKKIVKVALTLTMVLSVMVPATAKEVFADGYTNTSSSTAISDLHNSYGVSEQEMHNFFDGVNDITCEAKNDSSHVTKVHCYTIGKYTNKYHSDWIDCVVLYFNYSTKECWLTNQQSSNFPSNVTPGWYYYDSVSHSYKRCDSLHSHSFSYAANNGTITATCTGSGTCPDNYKTNGITLSLSANSNLTYNGQAKTATIGNWSASNVTNLAAKPTTVTYVNQTGTASYNSTTAPTNAGSYTAKITVGTAIASVNFTIAKANSSASPSANTLTYTGSPQELVNKGTVNGGTIKFSTSENGDYSESIPTGTDAKEYDVWYKVEGDTNHNNINPTKISNVKISPQPVKLSGVKVSNKTYDGNTTATVDTTNTPTFTGRLAVDDDSALSYQITSAAFADKNAGEGKTVNLTVELTGTNKANYTFASDTQKTATANISKKDITTTITPNGGYYGNVTSASASLSGTVSGDSINPVITYTGTNNEGTNYNNTVTPSKAGAYTITVTLGGNDANNYNLLNNTSNPTTDTFTIAKAQVTAPSENTNTFTYDKTEQIYSLTTSSLYEITNDKQTNAGTYEVKVALKDKNNYEWDDLGDEATAAQKVEDKKYSFVIDPLSLSDDGITLTTGLTLTIPETSFILTQEQLTNAVTKSLDITLKNGETSLLTPNDYTVTNGSKDAFGKYQVELEGVGNYTGSIVRDWSITETKQEPVTVDVQVEEGEDPYKGILTVTVTGEEDTPIATVNNPLSILTSAEIAALKDGTSDADIILTLLSKVIDNIDEDSKAEIEKISKGTKNIRFLDITLEKVLKTLDNPTDRNVINSVTIPITESEEPIEITIEVPEDIPSVRSGYSRKYTMIRSHASEVEGEVVYEAEALATTYKNGKVTFKTDKFSDYALMYVDTLIPVPSDSSNTAYIAPKTSVSPTTNSYKLVGLLPLAVATAVIAIKKKEN